MNFEKKFLEGQAGKSIGLTTGLLELDRTIDGIQRRAIYTIGAESKAGKTTLVDFAFLLKPYEEMMVKSMSNIHWIYYSLEISRIEKEFKFAAYFMYEDYKIYGFEHNGVKYTMSPRYLAGRLRDSNGNMVPVSPEHREKLFEIYQNRIIPLFGEYNENGIRVKKGVIDFIEENNNPTGIRNYLYHYAQENGELIFEEYTAKENGEPITKRRISGYKPNNPDKYVVVITDHVRRLHRERGFSIKENVDKMSSYQVEMRNLFGFTFVNVVHVNRNISSIDRIKYNKETLYPTADDVKETGNLGEDCNYLITLFNPKDEKYNLDTHFGLDLSAYPNYRSIHLVFSRDTECPKHLQAQMQGNINYFKSIKRS